MQSASQLCPALTWDASLWEVHEMQMPVSPWSGWGWEYQPCVLLIISISTTDLMQFLGLLGFYLHLSHISAINPEEATSSAPHVVRPSSCRCMLGLFLCRLVMMESFIQSFWCFLGTLIIYHLYCSLVKEEVPALIWAVQHFEVYSHQRLECDKHTEWSVAWRSMAVCFLFYMKPGHILSKRADQVPRWGVFIGAPPQPHTEAGQSLIDCVCQPTMLY